MTAAGGPLAGAISLVTGASGGIGRAVAAALSRQGARLVLVARRAGALEETARALANGAAVFPADLTADAAMDRLVESVEARFDGRLDVLVHCAGLYRRGAMERASVDDLDRQLEANVRAPYRLTRHLLPALKASHGEVVFVNSTQGLSASPEVGQFAATQHALRAIADSLRAEVNRDGVRVLTLHVGRTATARQAAICMEEGRPYRPERLLQPEDVASVLVSCLTLPRTAEVTSVTVRPMAGPA